MEYRYTAKYFDTNVLIKYEHTNDLSHDITNILEQIDLNFSYYRKDSILTKLNANKSVIANDDFIYVLDKGLFYSTYFGGIYDLTTAPLSQLYLKHELEQVIAFDNSKINYQDIKITGNHITIGKTQELDFGSIAKGYAADLIKAFLINQGCITGLINLGGNILVFGTYNKLAITNPEFNTERSSLLLTLKLEDFALVTSGISERYYQTNKQIIHHIINPLTMDILNNELLSVSIICKSAIDADALATACLLSGTINGINKLRQFKNTYGIFVTKDKQVILSDSYLTQLITGVAEDYNVYIFEK